MGRFSATCPSCGQRLELRDGDGELVLIADRSIPAEVRHQLVAR